MEKKPQRNKAEVASDENKADRVAELRNAATDRFKDMSDDDLRGVHAEATEMFKALNAEANSRGLPLGLGIVSEVKRDPAAGAVDGQFTVHRAMIGDRQYNAGDARTARVSEVIHLIESGAISPADDETAEAVKAFGGGDRAVVAPSVAAEEGE